MMSMKRREFLRGLVAGGCAGTGLLNPFSRALAASTGAEERILVVFEMSGGNEGLNTIVPYTDDHYYRQRPKLAIKPDKVLKLDDRWGLNPGLLGFKRLWDAGELAIVHGCGYEGP